MEPEIKYSPVRVTEILTTHRHPLIISILILIILTGTLSWAVILLKPQAKEQVKIVSTSTSQVDNSNWKTYRNEEYGFKINYPNNWSGIPKSDLYINDFDLTGQWYVQSTTSPLIHGIGLPPIGSMWVSINPIETCEEKSFYDINTDFYLEYKPDIAEKSICNGTFRIDVGLWQSDPDFINHKKILNQILSTFKFIQNDSDGMICVQVITRARNVKTGEVMDFPTPCDVPEGWVNINTPSNTF